MATSTDSLHWADYLVFALTLFLSCAIGLFYAITGGKQTTQKEILLGNRGMRPLPTAMSIVMSLLSSATVLGTPAEMYVHGTEYFMYSIGAVIGCVLSVLLWVPLLYPLNLTSSYQYFELRFQSKMVKVLGSIFLIISQILYIGIVAYSPSTALEGVTGFPAWGSIICLVLVATFYTMLGGMKAVIWADFFQSIILIGGILAILIVGCIEVGGFAEMWRINDAGGRVVFFDMDPDPRVRQSFWSLVVGGAAIWSGRLGVLQTSVQRFSSTPSLNQAKLTLILAAPGVVVIFALTCLSGMVIYAYFATCDPLTMPGTTLGNANQLAPYFVMKVFGWPGFPGLFLAVIYSAGLSTASSSLSAISAVVWEDLLKWRLDHLSDRAKSIILKLIVLVFGGVSIGMGFAFDYMGGLVLRSSISFISGAESPLLGLFVLGAFFPCANWLGAMVGAIFGMVCTMWVTIGSNIYKPVYPKPGVSIEGCFDPGFNETAMWSDTSTMYWNTSSTMTSIQAAVDEPSGLEQLYSMSYLWVPALGTVYTVVLGLIVSLISAPFIDAPKSSELDRRYFLPVCDWFCCCLPEAWRAACRCGGDGAEEEKEKAADELTYFPSMDDHTFDSINNSNGTNNYENPLFMNIAEEKTHL